MPQSRKESSDSKPLISWDFKPNATLRGFWWYVAAGVIAFVLIIYALAVKNFLFALIIVLLIGITTMNLWKEKKLLTAVISKKGIQVANGFFDFESIESFWVVYEPEGVQALFFDFKSGPSPTLAIPLAEQDPVKMRRLLLQYLKEDLEREYAPLSYQIARFMKL